MLKDKYPLKGEKEITKMLDAIEKGKIDEYMWLKILEKMYEEGDAEVLQEKIRDLILQKSRAAGDENRFMNTSQKKLTREQLNSQVV